MIGAAPAAAGKYGDDEIKLSNEKSAAFAWYQSKSIKESLAENQRDLLKTMLKAGSPVTGLKEEITDLDRNIARYKKEKREILLGSRAVGEENQVQDVAGKFGQITGAKEYETQIARLSDAGDRFDLSTLFLQLCLVAGAIGLVLKKPSTRTTFFWSMVSLGLAGAAFSAAGYATAWGS